MWEKRSAMMIEDPVKIALQSDNSWTFFHLLEMEEFEDPYGCFQKKGYPQIIHFNRVFHYKPSILGYPYFWKHPYIKVDFHLSNMDQPVKNTNQFR